MYSLLYHCDVCTFQIHYIYFQILKKLDSPKNLQTYPLILHRFLFFNHLYICFYNKYIYSDSNSLLLLCISLQAYVKYVKE